MAFVTALFVKNIDASKVGYTNTTRSVSY